MAEANECAHTHSFVFRMAHGTTDGAADQDLSHDAGAEVRGKFAQVGN